MKVLFFCRKMPDLCGAFLHDIDLATELQKRGHSVVFMTITVPKEGVNGGYYRGIRYMNYSANTSFLDTSDVWICPHAPVLPDVRKINSRGYNRPIIATCHYDGNYTSITGNINSNWKEMLMFINSIMEPNYRKNIQPWPSNIVKTEVIRPIVHREKIIIPEPFQGEYITLINANENKGVYVFIDLAKRMPHRKFLAVKAYYGIINLSGYPSNIEWVDFDDDIRNILRKTRVLVMPSYYESFGRVALEAMINGIPVLYSKPASKSIYPGGTTEGMQSWIGDAAIACSREGPDDWIAALDKLDNKEEYAELSNKAKEHILSMNLFQEGTRISELVESFSRQNPVVIRSSVSQQQQTKRDPVIPREPMRPVGFGFSNGRLKIQR
jgi:glycosyltransferase involved in cell wall biosynthesis